LYQVSESKTQNTLRFAFLILCFVGRSRGS